MSNSEISDSVSKGEIPDNMILIDLEVGRSKIHLFGINKVGCAIPLNKVEAFIKELESKCVNTRAIYKLPIEDTTIDIPGNRVSKIAQQLRYAKKNRVKLGNCKQYL